MDALDLLKTQVTGLRRDYANIIGDMSSQQLHWVPPGVANTISSTMLHSIGFVDNTVHRTAQGKTSIWDSGNWQQKLGTPQIGRQDLEGGRKLKLDIDLVKQYVSEVLAASQAYLNALGPGDLDRKVVTPRGENALGNLLSTAFVTHFADHMGEMSALKGCQGGKGWVS